jgi:hypothetical protein
MPWAGFESTISVFERTRIFHALDREVTVIGFRTISAFHLSRLFTDICNSSSELNIIAWPSANGNVFKYLVLDGPIYSSSICSTSQLRTISLMYDSPTRMLVLAGTLDAQHG